MEATAQCPYMTPRMAQMLTDFEEDNYHDLMKAIWQFAAKDREASRMKVPGKSVENSMRKLCFDKLGPQHAFRLLLSIPAPIVRACIKGTIGSQYQADAELSDSFYKMDAKHGIYLYTYTVDRGNGSKTSTLTRNEMVDLVAMMKRYKAAKGTIGNQEAGKIDHAYLVGTAHAATNEGKRAMLGARHGEKIDVLCKKLLERWCAKEDPLGTELQFQGPCGVGYSGNLSARGGKHVSEDLSQSNKSWALVMSCLKVMGLNIRRICVPILKIWDDGQRELGEILVTMLASSLVEDGGFNPTQAGCSNGSAGGFYESEDAEVFGERDILDQNVANCENMTLERSAIATNVTPLIDGSYSEEAEDKSIALRLQAEEVKNRGTDIKEGIETATAESVELKKLTQLQELELAFAIGLKIELN